MGKLEALVQEARSVCLDAGGWNVVLVERADIRSGRDGSTTSRTQAVRTYLEGRGVESQRIHEDVKYISGRPIKGARAVELQWACHPRQ